MLQQQTIHSEVGLDIGVSIVQFNGEGKPDQQRQIVLERSKSTAQHASVPWASFMRGPNPCLDSPGTCVRHEYRQLGSAAVFGIPSLKLLQRLA